MPAVRNLSQSRVETAAVLASIPGVRLKEVREFLGLPPLENDRQNDMILNLPHQAR